ncbi:MAG: DUF1684 domain-containing protein [Candidatus Kapabacteria bacterium]|nr:DUF1684 domain-containing protein [Candidatus Kapabacteria bacterium]
MGKKQERNADAAAVVTFAAVNTPLYQEVPFMIVFAVRYMSRAARFLVPMLVTAAALCLHSCGGSEEEETADLNAVPADAQSLQKARARKDTYFKFDSGSPIVPALRKAFSGLRYYPYSDDYVVIAAFEEAANPDTVRIPATKGDIRTMLRIGTFSFSFSGSDAVYTLNGYRDAESDGASILIPFKDKTTGGETYSAGRYVEVDENGGVEYTVDFNKAYNPYCAYNPAYSCVLVPLQNVLNVAIKAGEKTPPQGISAHP